SCGPHQITIGKREARQVEIELFSRSGQAAGWPSGELDQSRARMSAPILPPPSRNARAAGEPAAFIGHLSTAAGRGPPVARRRSPGAEACLARSVPGEFPAVARFCSFPPRVGMKLTRSRVFVQPPGLGTLRRSEADNLPLSAAIVETGKPDSLSEPG